MTWLRRLLVTSRIMCVEGRPSQEVCTLKHKAVSGQFIQNTLTTKDICLTIDTWAA
jgi:hypothetical protein